MTRLPLKTITALVCTALTAILIYQAYLLYNLYVSQKEEMETAVVEAMRISDYNEMVLRMAKMAAHQDKGPHGSVSFQTGYALNKDKKLVNQGTRTTVSTHDSETVVMQQTDWRDSLTIKRKTTGLKRYVSVDINSQRTGSNAHSTPIPDHQLFDTTVDTHKSEEDLTQLIQRGIHEGIDIISQPDVATFDSLLTARLADRHIDTRHRLYQLQVLPDTLLASTIDTLRVITTPGYTPSVSALSFDYPYSSSHHRLYRLYIEPVGSSVLRQMSGLLASSAMTLMVVAFVFWYIIHTLLRQRSLDEMKDDFTHNMTHKLKTPIAVAYAANDALLHFGQGDDAATRDKYLRMAQEQLLKLSGMVEQVLSMSMERRRSFTLNREQLPLADALRPVVEMQQLKAAIPLTLSLDIAPEDLTVTADRMHLCQMMTNLIDNAVKYSIDKADVQIRCRQEPDGAVSIAVTDHGIGIAKEHRAHLFDKFYRVPNGNLQQVRGYGIGLYYVATMMRLHGGTVTVESTPGKGSTFRLVFNQPD
ncbi:MAG: HAMP domain-containing histidine kinase [Bacteroidales bacterium]|nr:HAMP domain-containing histidine kinase [Bacteroidales bacterium]